MILHLKNEKFKDEVKEGIVIVDFFAEWCGPCKMLAPVLEALSKENEDIKIIKVDIDQHLDLAQEFSIMSVPTMLFYKDGEPITKKTGFLPKELIMKEIENFK